MALQFVIHECPPTVTRALVAEARRLLRSGGVLLLNDNDPRSLFLFSTHNLPCLTDLQIPLTDLQSPCSVPDVYLGIVSSKRVRVFVDRLLPGASAACAHNMARWPTEAGPWRRQDRQGE